MERYAILLSCLLISVPALAQDNRATAKSETAEGQAWASKWDNFSSFDDQSITMYHNGALLTINPRTKEVDLHGTSPSVAAKVFWNAVTDVAGHPPMFPDVKAETQTFEHPAVPSGDGMVHISNCPPFIHSALGPDAGKATTECNPLEKSK